MTDVLLPISLVGSYAQPDWLINRNKLAGRGAAHAIAVSFFNWSVRTLPSADKM